MQSKWVSLAIPLIAVAIKIILVFVFNYGISVLGFVKKLGIYCAVTVVGALLLFFGLASFWGGAHPFG
jgi:hypothetical protein